MDNYRVVLKQVAKVLIAVGIVDIAAMAYCIANGQSYSSSLNIFAVIAGIFLWRGHLGAVRIVTRFSAFMLAAAIGMVFLLPTLQPASLWLVEIRLNPVRAFFGVMVAIAVLGLLIWVYRQLRVESVVQALARAGRPSAPPTFAFGIGAVLPVVMAIALHYTLGGSAGVKAVALAREQYGDLYQYTPNAINWSSGRVHARLTAYNDREVKTVEVEWSD